MASFIRAQLILLVALVVVSLVGASRGDSYYGYRPTYNYRPPYVPQTPYYGRRQTYYPRARVPSYNPVYRPESREYSREDSRQGSRWPFNGFY